MTSHAPAPAEHRTRRAAAGAPRQASPRSGPTPAPDTRGDGAQPPRAARRELLLLALVLLGGLVLRGMVSQRGLWLDETISYTQTHGLSASEIVARQFNGVHPPLYHLLLGGWTSLFGDSPLGMRSLSMVWSAAGIAAVWAWSREAMPHRSGIPAAAFAAFSPFAVWYGTEARMYAQLFALSAVAGWLTWRLLVRGPSRGRVAALVVAVAALAFTHYFGLLMIGALGLVVLSQIRGPRRRAALTGVASLAVPVVLIGAWGLLVMANRSTDPLTTVFDRPDFFTVVIAGIEMVAGFHDYRELGTAAAAWPLLCILAIAALPYLGRPTWRTGGLALCAGLPVLVLIAAALLRSSSVFDSRYLTVMVPAAYILAGRLWQAVPGVVMRRSLGAALLAIAALATVRAAYDPGNPRLYGLRDAVETINDYAAPGDGAMLVPQVNELSGDDPVLGYYGLQQGITSFDTTPDGRAGTVPPAEMWRRLSATKPGRIFVVYGYDALSYAGAADRRQGLTRGSTVRRTYDAYLAERGRRIATVRFPNVQLVAYDLSWEAGR